MTDNLFINMMHWDLEQAIRNNNEKNVTAFLQRGVDFNDKTAEGLDMLSLAASRGHSEITRLLIKEGADVNKKSRFGMTPLMHAAVNGHVGMTRLLLEAGAEIDARCNSGATALMCAVNRDKIQSARLLIEHGADITIRTTVTYGGRSALETAILYQWAEMAQMLREVPAMRRRLADAKKQAAAMEEARKLRQASHAAATHGQQLSAAHAHTYVVKRRMQP